jgi:hypothetical protein
MGMQRGFKSYAAPQTAAVSLTITTFSDPSLARYDLKPVVKLIKSWNRDRANTMAGYCPRHRTTTYLVGSSVHRTTDPRP